MNPFLRNLGAFLRRLTPGQQFALGVVLIGGVALLVTIAMWANKPEYALLFDDLDPDDANRSVEALRERGIKYELGEQGSAIYVPRERVYELRLEFAGEGLVTRGPIGYNLFDQNTLGMTDFMQKLNLRRALEGELARTIGSLKRVEEARVHLVMPERSPFKRTQNTPSASVVLRVASGQDLSPTQIEAVTALVAGAVEGLSSAEVTVLDTRGNLMSDPESGDSDYAFASNQLRLQVEKESHLTSEAQSMLDQMLGVGNAIVRVTATLDFSRAVADRKIIDPESATVVSEERIDQLFESDNVNSAVKNYELSETLEHTEKGVGDIDFLTVSVILNYQRITGGNAEGVENETFAPYPDGVVTEIESIVKNAVGFKADRGDSFAIQQIQFDTTHDRGLAQELEVIQQNEQLEQYLRYALMAIALILALWLMRAASRKATELVQPSQALDAHQRGVPQLAEGQGAGTRIRGPGSEQRMLEGWDENEEIPINDIYASKLSAEARQRMKAREKLFEEIKKQSDDNPEIIISVLRSWMSEEMALSYTEAA